MNPIKYGKTIDFFMQFGKAGEAFVNIAKIVFVKLSKIFKHSIKLSEEETRNAEIILNKVLVWGKDYDEIWMPMIAIGDAVSMFSLMKSYKETRKINKIGAVVREYQQFIPDLFSGIDGKYILSNEEFSCLFTYFKSKNMRQNSNFHVGWNPGNTKVILMQKGAIARTSRIILECNQTLKIEQPILPQKSINKNYHKSILLVPYAYCLAVKDEGFWLELAEKFKNLGYEVYTNIGGRDGEKIIPHTLPFTMNMKDLMSCCEEFAEIICVRTGLCDCVGLTEANISILYPYESYIHEWDDDGIAARENVHTFVIGRNRKDTIDALIEYAERGKNDTK